MNKKNRDVRDLVVEPEDAEIVKLIFQKYVYEGCGALRICRYLTEQNIRKKDGKAISVGIINRAIQNPIYIGVLQRGASKSEVLPALKIVDEEVFARAQEIISARTVQHREVPLTTRGEIPFGGKCLLRLLWSTAGIDNLWTKVPPKRRDIGYWQLFQL